MRGQPCRLLRLPQAFQYPGASEDWEGRRQRRDPDPASPQLPQSVAGPRWFRLQGRGGEGPHGSAGRRVLLRHDQQGQVCLRQDECDRQPWEGVQWDDKRPAFTRTRGASSSSQFFVLCSGKLSIPLKKSSVQCWLTFQWPGPWIKKRLFYGIVPSPTWKNYDFSEKVYDLSTFYIKNVIFKRSFKVLYWSSVDWSFSFFWMG